LRCPEDLLGLPPNDVFVVSAIAESFDLSVLAVVKNHAKREDTSPSVTEAVAVTMQQRGERHTGRVAGLTERMLMTFEQLSEGALSGWILRTAMAAM